jgi:hypothetical protein
MSTQFCRAGIKPPPGTFHEIGTFMGYQPCAGLKWLSSGKTNTGGLEGRPADWSSLIQHIS